MARKEHSKEVPEWILSKLRQYCAYQERCINDVRIKLQTFPLQGDISENIINLLIKEDFINEERYARLYASGKFRINKWGKNKIYAALSQNGIPELFILEGLNEIEPDDYMATLRKLIAMQSKTIKETDVNRRYKKLVNFAVGRGFEPNLVWVVLKEKE
jgi:regulatory protein